MVKAQVVVERFLRALETGDWQGFERHLTADVVYDASLPGWRYRVAGPEAVLGELRQGWTGKHRWRIEEALVQPTPDGATVELELRGTCPGDEDHDRHEEACRMANVFRIEGDRIAEHRVYSCGEWDEETVRRIDAELRPAGRRSK